MVPNHARGIDSRWARASRVVHGAGGAAFPNYRFDGENLSPRPGDANPYRAGLLFTQRCRGGVCARARDGRRRYIHHGNDGTGLPWNDTAQLDHTCADVRQGDH